LTWRGCIPAQRKIRLRHRQMENQEIVGKKSVERNKAIDSGNRGLRT